MAERTSVRLDGIAVAELEIRSGIDLRLRYIDRFDRVVDADGRLRRIHQEDLCQATGTSPRSRRGRATYEEHGGPGFLRLAELLSAYAADPLRELEQLVRVLTFTVLIGNGDAHAKNLALLHPTAETVALARPCS